MMEHQQGRRGTFTVIEQQQRRRDTHTISKDCRFLQVNPKCQLRREIGFLVPLIHKLLKHQTYPIYEGANVIGRDDNIDISIGLSTLSRRHACIEVTHDGSFLVYDMHSKNRTKREKTLLKPGVRYRLSDGDILKLSNLKCKFYVYK